METPAEHRPQRRALWLLVGGLLIGLAIGGAVWFWFGPGRTAWAPASSKPLPPEVSKSDTPAPDFELATLQGEPVRLSELHGKVVALNFWATWCGPCRLEMPLLQEAQQKHPGELAVLAINFEESDGQVQKFVDDLSLDLPILMDRQGEVNALYRVRGFPTTLFVDRSGNLRYAHIGILNASSLSGYLDDLGVEK